MSAKGALETFNETMKKLAKLNGPGSIPEKTVSHRVRIDQSKLDHFLSFIYRPYFYQDVAFGMCTMTLNSREKIEMPNVIRTVTRSTMIALYQKYCEEEKFVPISRSTRGGSKDFCD